MESSSEFDNFVPAAVPTLDQLAVSKSWCWNCCNLCDTEEGNWVQDFSCSAYNSGFPVHHDGRPHAFPCPKCPQWRPKLGLSELAVAVGEAPVA